MHHSPRFLVIVALASIALGGLPDHGHAQGVRPAPLVEGALGFSGFVDEALIKHVTAAGGARAFVTPRLSIGPQITYMNGPGADRDWEVTGVAALDLRRGSPRAVPYLIVAGGFTQTTLPVGTGLYTSHEGALSGGAGVRLALGRHIYVAPEFRIGWEPIVRWSVSLGFRP